MKKSRKTNNILIGITGCIAAYKSCYLIRLLKKNQYNVKVILTENAKKFIGKATVETLSGEKAYDTLWEDRTDTSHISLTDWADIFIIAPVTANIIGKCANGIADDLLSTVFLSCNKKTIFVPAMNERMWDNPIVKMNIKKLSDLGYIIMQPDEGFLACNAFGKGRMPNPDNIYDLIKRVDFPSEKLSGKRIIITGGAVSEKIDPVRVISNLSSGKMAKAMAKACYYAKADAITFIHGELSIAPPEFSNNIKVNSADEMLEKIEENIDNHDILIMSAAVSDYKPKKYSDKKIKKADKLEIELVKNIDILKKLKDKNILKIGFALETNDHKKNAEKKLLEKDLNYIIINSQSAIGSDDTVLSILSKSGDILEDQKGSKLEIAHKVIKWIKF